MPKKRENRNTISVILTDREHEAVRRWARAETRSVAQQIKHVVLNDLRDAGYGKLLEGDEKGEEDERPPS